MRYVTVHLEPDDGGAFHPLGERLTADPSVERWAIHHVELLADDTVLLLAEASGSRERYREIMEESPHVEDYLVAGEDRWMAVSQFHPTEPFRRALKLQRESQFVGDTPIRVSSDGGLEVTYRNRRGVRRVVRRRGRVGVRLRRTPQHGRLRSGRVGAQ